MKWWVKSTKVCTALNYIENLIILASVVTECVSVSAFASLVGIPIGIANSAVGFKICTITIELKKHKSITQKRGKIMLKQMTKTKLNSIEVLIYMALIDSYISHYEFVSVNNVLRADGDMKDVIKKLRTSTVHQRF